jgi:hypothetical protein
MLMGAMNVVVSVAKRGGKGVAEVENARIMRRNEGRAFLELFHEP